MVPAGPHPAVGGTRRGAVARSTSSASGGAGMSGLAARRARRSAQTSPGRTGPSRPTADACAPPASSRSIGHAAGARAPRARRSCVSTAIADDNPELRDRARARSAVLHRGDLLAEVARLKRSHRGVRHARQDHHREHGRPRLVASGPRPRLPDRRRVALDTRPTRPGGVASGSWSRPTNRTAPSSSSTPRSR